METLEEKLVKTIKIDEAEIILQDGDKFGQGKIIITRGSNAYTYSWGAMRDTLADFICRISAEYFTQNLIPPDRQRIFSGKLTAKNIRRHIREECSCELPWYKFMEGQKVLREKIKEIEYITDQHNFIQLTNSIEFDLSYETGMSHQDEEDFLKIVKGIFDYEPWSLIVLTDSPEYKWMLGLHKKLKMKLLIY